jgi:hypothetical protein
LYIEKRFHLSNSDFEGNIIPARTIHAPRKNHETVVDQGMSLEEQRHSQRRVAERNPALVAPSAARIVKKEIVNYTSPQL